MTDFRVPLPAEAMRVVERRRDLGGPYLFSRMGTKPIARIRTQNRMRDLEEAGRPHGFRASFRTWVQDNRVCDSDISEMVLGHVVGSKVERAYARSDLLDVRRPVMEAWARHLTGSASNVIRIRREASA